MSTSPPTLLGLPPEIRHHIYSYLIPESSTSHPLPGIGLTSVSRRLPTAPLLNTTPQLSDDILDYYYDTATWKLVLSPDTNFFRIDPDFKNLEHSVVLTRLRKLEFAFLCDSIFLSRPPSFDGPLRAGLEQYTAELSRRTSQACQVILKAEKLRALSVSWIDVRGSGHSDSLREMPLLRECAVFESLANFASAKPSVDVSLGRVAGPPRAWFEGIMQRVMRKRSESIRVEDQVSVSASMHM